MTQSETAAYIRALKALRTLQEKKRELMAKPTNTRKAPADTASDDGLYRSGNFVFKGLLPDDAEGRDIARLYSLVDKWATLAPDNPLRMAATVKHLKYTSSLQGRGVTIERYEPTTTLEVEKRLGQVKREITSLNGELLASGNQNPIFSASKRNRITELTQEMFRLSASPREKAVGSGISGSAGAVSKAEAGVLTGDETFDVVNERFQYVKQRLLILRDMASLSGVQVREKGELEVELLRLSWATKHWAELSPEQRQHYVTSV